MKLCISYNSKNIRKQNSPAEKKRLLKNIDAPRALRTSRFEYNRCHENISPETWILFKKDKIT